MDSNVVRFRQAPKRDRRFTQEDIAEMHRWMAVEAASVGLMLATDTEAETGQHSLIAACEDGTEFVSVLGARRVRLFGGLPQHPLVATIGCAAGELEVADEGGFRVGRFLTMAEALRAAEQGSDRRLEGPPRGTLRALADAAPECGDAFTRPLEGSRPFPSGD